MELVMTIIVLVTIVLLFGILFIVNDRRMASFEKKYNNKMDDVSQQLNIVNRYEYERDNIQSWNIDNIRKYGATQEWVNQESIPKWENIKDKPTNLARTDDNASLTANTMNVKENANVKGDVVFNGDNKWIVSTPDDGRKTMYIAPFKNGNWDWSSQTKLDNDGRLTSKILQAGPGPNWEPGNDFNTQGTIINADGQIRSRNTSESGWIHKLYGRENKTIHMLHNDGYGIHINTRDNNGNKYAIETHNLNGPTFQVRNDGKQIGWGKDTGDWNWRQYNSNGGNVHMNHGQGIGIHVNTNNRENSKYAIETHNGTRATMQVKNDGEIVQYRKDGRATHFDHVDGKNYIRGDTIVDGQTTFNGNMRVNGRIYLGNGRLYIEGDDNSYVIARDDGVQLIGGNTMDKLKVIVDPVSSNRYWFWNNNRTSGRTF